MLVWLQTREKFNQLASLALSEESLAEDTECADRLTAQVLESEIFVNFHQRRSLTFWLADQHLWRGQKGLGVAL